MTMSEQSSRFVIDAAWNLRRIFGSWQKAAEGLAQIHAGRAPETAPCMTEWDAKLAAEIQSHIDQEVTHADAH